MSFSPLHVFNSIYRKKRDWSAGRYRCHLVMGQGHSSVGKSPVYLLIERQIHHNPGKDHSLPVTIKQQQEPESQARSGKKNTKVRKLARPKRNLDLGIRAVQQSGFWGRKNVAGWKTLSSCWGTSGCGQMWEDGKYLSLTYEYLGWRTSFKSNLKISILGSFENPLLSF